MARSLSPIYFLTTRIPLVVVIGLYIASLLGPATVVGEDPDPAGDGQVGQHSEEERPRRKAPPSFGIYRAEFKRFTAAIVADGRRGDLEVLVKDRLDYTAPCRECRAFFKEMISALKSVKNSTIPAPPRQREPSIEAIQRTVDLALALTSGRTPQEEASIVARDWIAVFSAGPAPTIAARDYFATLIPYLEAAFREFLDQQATEHIAPPTPTLPFPDKEQFFDF
ncbi:MAG: hypothetical protein QY326_07710 [Bdellovibrionota bacterium]|nr:MAG: hypothetical protein QY326_07710 [Bdellovibrionota bacterium]